MTRNGFTLVEMLVSLLIFSIIATIANFLDPRIAELEAQQ